MLGVVQHLVSGSPTQEVHLHFLYQREARAALNIIVKERKDPKGFCSQRFSYIQQLQYIDDRNFLSPELQARNLT